MEKTVKDIQLEKMSVKELMALEIEVKEAIVSRKHAEKAEAKEKILAAAEKTGYSFDELFGKARRGNGGGKGTVAPKYRNPANPSETWTGRGRMPLWIKALTEKGAKREKFLIK